MNGSAELIRRPVSKFNMSRSLLGDDRLPQASDLLLTSPEVCRRLQQSFDVASSFRNKRFGLDIDGLHFTKVLTRLVACEDINHQSIFIVPAISPPEPTNGKPWPRDGDFFNACLNGYWVLDLSAHPNPTEGTPVRVRFVGFSQPEFQRDESTDEDKVYLLVLERALTSAIVISCPANFIQLLPVAIESWQKARAAASGMDSFTGQESITGGLCRMSVSNSSIVEVLGLIKRMAKRNFVEIISPEAMNVPFVFRDVTVSELHNFILSEVNLTPSQRPDKAKHEIALLAAMPGFGKTRTLLELRNVTNRFNNNNNESHHMVHLYVTYNQAYGESSWERSHDAAEILLAWRMLYFYFVPCMPWFKFLEIIRSGERIIPLTVFMAMSIISRDVHQQLALDDAVVVIVVLCIDEYQQISDDMGSRIRLINVIKEISAVVCQDPLNFGILVPIFSGLYWIQLREAASAASIQLRPIAMAPLEYDHAAEIVRHYTGDRSIMLNSEVRDVVSKLSAAPGYLVQVLDRKKQNNSWVVSLHEVCLGRGLLKQEISTIIALLIAHSITGVPVPDSVCSVEVLDAGSFCWFRDRVANIIGVPYTVMYMAARAWHRNVNADLPVPMTYLCGFQDSLALLCYESTSGMFPHWRRLELLKTSHMALLINSLGLISGTTKGPVKLPLTAVLRHAHICDSAKTIIVTLMPIAVRSSEFNLSGDNMGYDSEQLGNCRWDLGHCLMMGPDDQEVVDSYMVFRDCSMNGRVFDLLFFDQCKLCTDSGLVPATYEAAINWCRNVIRSYKAKYAGRRAGFIFGVTNPIKMLSQQVKNKIESLAISNDDDLEFYYGMGRKECTDHYSNFLEHPVLTFRVYINEVGLSEEMLAIALPNGWTYRHERAKQIISYRPVSGYKSWDEIVLNAKLDNDETMLQLPIPRTIEETAVRFY